MAAEVNIEVKAQVDDAVRGLGQLNKGFDLMKRANQDAAGALGVFGVSLTALNSPLTAIASGVKDSIDSTLKWADTIDKLSRASGETAAETSKMAVVFEDFGISADGLDKVIKTFTKNGLQFNMDTIKDLAKQYQAIQDPVERDKFAFDNFGRSALDMTEILSKTPAELQAVGDAALYSGKIMDEQAVEAAQHFGVQLKQLTDQLDGLKIQVGGPLVDALSTAISAFHGLTGIVQANAIQTQLNMGMMTQQEAIIRATAAANGDLWASSRQLTAAEKEQLAAQNNAIAHVPTPYVREAARAYSDAADIIAGYTNNVDLQAESQMKAQKATDDYNAAIANQTQTMLLSAGMSGTITKAEEDYRTTIQGNQVEIDKLNADIAKYSALQGDTVTINTKVTTTQNEYNLALAKAAEAQKKYTDYTGTDTLKKLELAVAVDKANESVTKLGEGMGVASTVTLDYTKRISEDQTALDKLNSSNDAAAAAIAKTTGQFIYQQEVALIKDPAVLTQVAFRLGLIDSASYNLAQNVVALTKKWDLNKDGMIEVGKEADGLSADLAKQQQNMVDDANRTQPQIQGAFLGTGGAAKHAAEDVDAFSQSINNIPTTHTTTINTIYGAGGPGYEPPHAAGGADFIVPPGYGGDNFPVYAQTGEHVQITPANVTNNYTVNASYGGSTAPGAVARELRLMNKLNR